MTEFIKANPHNGKWNYESIKIIRKIVKKSAKGTTNMSRIEATNQLMYILHRMKISKELWMMCKMRIFTTRD